MLRNSGAAGGIRQSPLKDLPLLYYLPPFHLSLGHPVLTQEAFITILGPSLLFLHVSAKLIYKHHFAHVATLLKANFQELFCTWILISAKLIYLL